MVSNMSLIDELWWAEKYRPKTVSECILPEETKQIFQKMVSSGTLSMHLLLHGSAGTGKTAVAKAMCEELGVDYLFVNASNERNIDTLRTKIAQFASSVSIGGGIKVVILDEADYLNKDSTQPALRAFMEEFSSNCKFILTCNFPNRLIDAIRSRCTEIQFRVPDEEKKHLMGMLLKRVVSILDSEGVAYDKRVVATIITKFFPDNRRILNILQKFHTLGSPIDSGVLSSLVSVDFEDLLNALRHKNFTDMRKWVAFYGDNDPAVVFRRFYDESYTIFKKESIPEVVLLIARYQEAASVVADQEINLAAFLTEIMMNVEFVDA